LCSGVVVSLAFNIVSADERKVALHCSSGHAGLEGCASKSQQGQQNVVHRVTAEETTHQGSKLQLMVPEIREMDGEKGKASYDSCLSDDKHGTHVTESDFVEKIMKREVKLSSNLVSKDKCEMDQSVPYNSSVSEAKKYAKSLPKYPVVRRLSLQYYTTIGEYFGKDLFKTDDEIKHATKDCGRNLREKEFTSNGQNPRENMVKTVIKKEKPSVKVSSQCSKTGQQAPANVEKSLVKESQQCSSEFQASGHCKRNESSLLLLKGKNRRKTSEDITNLTKNTNMSELDLKCVKNKKKRKRILELFGEDPDEPSGKKSDSSDGLGMKVLQGNNARSVSTKVSDRFANTSELDTRLKDTGSRVCQPITISHKHAPEMSSFVKGTLRHSDENKTKESVDQQSASSHHEGGVQKQVSQKSVLVMKGNDCGGCHELELSVTCSTKEGTDSGTMALDDRLKHDESSSLTHKSDIHLTGSIKEGTNGDFHLIINMGITDALFPGPEKCQSVIGVKLPSSVNCHVAKDVNEASNGHSTNMEGHGHVSAEECIEIADEPLGTVERVAEKRVVSAGGSENVSVINIPEVALLHRDETGSVDTHVLSVPHSACAEQNPPGNQHHTVTSSRSVPPVSLVPLDRGSVTDSASESQVLSVPEQTKQIEDQIFDIYAETSSSQSLPEEGMAIRKEKETGKGVVHDEDIQRKSDTVGKNKSLPESNALLTIACRRESCNISQSPVDPNQSQSSAALEKNSSSSGEASSSDGCQSSVGSDQLPNGLLGVNSPTTNLSQSVVFPQTSSNTNDIPDVVGAPASHNLLRIRVRDPESLGITRPRSSFFETMDTKLRELTEVTYILLQDIVRFKQRFEALSRLTGSLRDTERALAQAEFANPHQILKTKTFLGLYKYVEKSFSGETEGFLIKRLSELNPGWTYTSELLKKCWNYCIWVHRNSENNVVNSDHTSGQATVSSFPYRQQYQQQPVGVPLPNNVAGSATSVLTTLLEGGRQTSLNSEANLNSKQQSSASVDNVASVAQIQHTSGRKEIVTNTAGFVMKPPSHDRLMREAGTNLNTRHAQVRNIFHQHPTYNRLQAPNSSRIFQTHSHSNPHVPQLVPAGDRAIPPNPYVPQTVPATDRTIPPSVYLPHTVSATDRIIPLAHVPVSNTPSQTRTGSRLLSHTCREQSTVQPAVAGRASGYSQPNVFSHSYPPNQRGTASFNTPNTLYSLNRAVEQGTSTQRNSDILQNTNRRVTYPNGSTQQGRILNVVNQNTVLSKSASNSFSQPYPRNSAIQQDTVSQAVRNSVSDKCTATCFSQHYPRNAIQQGTFCCVNNVYPVASAPNSYCYSYPQSETVQQGTFSQPVSSTSTDMSVPNPFSQSYANNVAVAVPGTAPYPSGYPNQPNQASTYHLSNDPSSSLTGSAQNVLLNAGPTREIYGYVHQTRNNRFHSPSSYSVQSSSYTQQLRPMMLQSEQRVNVQEHHASVGQGNGKFYSRVSCGLSQQHQAPPVASGSELQSCGTPQSVSSRRRSYGKGNANITASSNFCEGRNMQNVPAGSGISYSGNNRSGYLGNSTASNSQSDKRKSEGVFLASSAASDRLCDVASVQSEPVSSSISRRENIFVSVANSRETNILSDRGNNQRSGYIVNSTASHSVCDKGNSEGVSLANSAASDRLSDVASAQNEPASSSLSRRENNCVSVADRTETNSLSDRGNNQCSGYILNSTASHSICDKGNSEGVSLANSAASDRLSDVASAQNEPSSSSLSRRENNCVSVADRTETNSISDRGNNQRSGIFANSTTNNNVYDSGSNKTQPLASTATNDSVSDTGNSQNGSFLNSTAGDGLSVCENSHSVPPAVVDIPSLIPLQARLKDVNQQSNRLTEKEPACDAGKQIMSSITQDDISGAPITGNCGEVTLRTYQKRTNDAESINQSERVEVFGCTKDVQVGAVFGGAEDAHLVENVVGRKDKCVSNGILAKHLSSHSSLSDPETGLRSDVAGEEGNSSTAEVASELLEEREVTILTDCVCVPISTPESREMSASLNNTSADITEEAAGSDNNREPESEIEVVSSMLLLSHL
jgi:hypothetical protein